jgi:neurofibromin 1
MCVLKQRVFITVTPVEMGILDRQPSPQVKRGLMLMSKILQNIANHVEFSKEQHMLPFNNFLWQVGTGT